MLSDDYDILEFLIKRDASGNIFDNFRIPKGKSLSAHFNYYASGFKTRYREFTYVDDLTYNISPGYDMGTEANVRAIPVKIIGYKNTIPAVVVKEKTEEIYSTEETVIGKWIDGKPLYRKVITFPVPATSTMGTAATHIFNIGNDIDYAFIEHNHMLDSVKDRHTMPVAGYKNNVYYFAKANLKNDGTGYFQNSNSNWGNNCSVVISVLYTKTTD